jgi:predicted NAD/FAD-binding protein
MSSAIWSCPENEILNFPAKSLLTFFKNHQLINFVFRPKWRTVKNGSKEYVKNVINELEKKTGNSLLLKTKIKSISLQKKKVKIDFENKSRIFDKVIMATHPDQAIKLIKNLDKKTQNLLENFKYQKNVVYLHSDLSLMPNNKKTWSSWNYLSNNKKKNSSSITYWMNLLQKLNTSTNIFVSLNPYIIPTSNLTYNKIIYEHPIFNNNTNKAQNKIALIQGQNNIYFTGAWLGYGFHEDGIKSAVKVAKLLQANIPWEFK